MIIGRREEDEVKIPGQDAHDQAESGERRYSSEEEEGVLVAGDVELEEDLESSKRRQEEEDILHLGSDEEDGKPADALIPDLRR